MGLAPARTCSEPSQTACPSKTGKNRAGTALDRRLDGAHDAPDNRGLSVAPDPLTPDADLVEVHADELADLAVRHAIRGQQDDPGPLRDPRLNRVRAHTALQLDPLLIADVQRK